MGKAEREKGKRGEREVARMLRLLGFDSHRSQQYCGKTGDADDVVGVDGYHIEVKRREKLSIMEWVRQTERDCNSEDIPVVVFRQNGEPWRVVLDAIDFFSLVKEVQDAVHKEL